MKHYFLAITVSTALLSVRGCDLIMVCTGGIGFAVTPTHKTVRVGETFSAHARAWSCGGGQAVPLDVNWSVSDSAIARVDLSGRVTGIKAGTASVIGIDRGHYGAGPFRVMVVIEQ
ncbi:MAG TPA: Ig-like domain-containing protein [Longimicrobiales bacterium]|nr:Ig-like domain-containing protein [Longimicrobiales bacterium]